jgi:hypothetical protein
MRSRSFSAQNFVPPLALTNRRQFPLPLIADGRMDSGPPPSTGWWGRNKSLSIQLDNLPLFPSPDASGWTQGAAFHSRRPPLFDRGQFRGTITISPGLLCAGRPDWAPGCLSPQSPSSRPGRCSDRHRGECLTVSITRRLAHSTEVLLLKIGPISLAIFFLIQHRLHSEKGCKWTSVTHCVRCQW